MNYSERAWNFFLWASRGVLVLINNLYCIPTYVLWTFMLSPLKLISEDLYWTIEGQFFYWLLTMVAFWSYSAGYIICETGDDIDSIIDDEALVLINHQSTSDVPLVMSAFSGRNRILQNIMWIMDGVFKYTNFGIVSARHGDFFISSGKDKRDASVHQLKQFLQDVFLPRNRKWIVLFPEGGFLRKRKEVSTRFAEKNNFPKLEHVTLPRMGAVQAIMDTIGPKKTLHNGEMPNGVPNNNLERRGQLKYVVDLTIAYPNGDPLDLGTVICGSSPPCNIYFHYRVYPISEVPTNSEKLQTWLFTRYHEKDVMLGKYYETGVWSSGSSCTNLDNKENEVALSYEYQGSQISTENTTCSISLTNIKDNPVNVLNGEDSSSHCRPEDESSTCIIKPASDTFTNTSSNNSKATLTADVPRRVEHDLLRIAILHLFFIASTGFHAAMAYELYRYFQS